MAEWLRLERDVYRGAARLFPWSDFTARSLIEDYGCDPARVVRVGAGTNLMASSLEHKRYDEPVALFVGIDFERKGAWTFCGPSRKSAPSFPRRNSGSWAPACPRPRPSRACAGSGGCATGRCSPTSTPGPASS